MLRATSEMAAAIMVRSLPSKPSLVAAARPCWRALTMSAAELIDIRSSLGMRAGPYGMSVQISQPLLQIQGCSDPFQGQPQLHHREGDIRLDADNDGLRPAQFEHVR